MSESIEVFLQNLHYRGVRVRQTDKGPVLVGNLINVTNKDLEVLKANREEVLKLTSNPKRRLVLLPYQDVLAEGNVEELSLETMRKIANGRWAAGEHRGHRGWIQFVEFNLAHEVGM